MITPISTVDLIGLSTDDKPTRDEYANGTTLLEMDTGDIYRYDGEGNTWIMLVSGNNLPNVTSTDNGKVLKVVAGKWAKGAETVELPAVTAEDNGKVLTVVEGAWAKYAETVELPTVTAEDNGKVLTVVSGAWAAAALPEEE